MKRVPLTVSLPPDLARKFERWAKAEAKNKSQLFRDMFRAYEQRRLEQISKTATVVRTQPHLHLLADEPDNRILECAALAKPT